MQDEEKIFDNEEKGDVVEEAGKEQSNGNDGNVEGTEENSTQSNEQNENTENNECNEEESNSEVEEKDALTIALEEKAAWEDKYKRLLAEFDNFRKRSEKENAAMCDIGTSVALTKILPVVDNIERALDNVPEDLKENAFVDGIDKTYKMILKIFEDMDVKPIEALGKPFDSNLHNAVMTDEESDAEVDTVTQELQKGWTYKETVLRYAMVKVKK